MLREPSSRVMKHLEAIGKRFPDHHAWLVNDDGEVESITLDFFTNKDNKERIGGKTVVLDPCSGGLNGAGLLNGSSEIADDFLNPPNAAAQPTKVLFRRTFTKSSA